MKQLTVRIKGTAGDRDVLSPRLEDQDAEEQLSTIANRVGEPKVVKLPWLAVRGADIIYVQSSGV
jgi:hypothetical protein